MSFYLVKLLINQEGEDGSSLAIYNDLDKAKVAYHNTLASYHNAPDVKYAAVKILDDSGRDIIGYYESVDHRFPEPEPEPETEE